MGQQRVEQRPHPLLANRIRCCRLSDPLRSDGQVRARQKTARVLKRLTEPVNKVCGGRERETTLGLGD